LQEFIVDDKEKLKLEKSDKPFAAFRAEDIQNQRSVMALKAVDKATMSGCSF